MSTIQSMLPLDVVGALHEAVAPEGEAAVVVPVTADTPVAVKADKPSAAGQRIRTPRVAKHPVRVTDGVRHPVTILNLDDMTDAQVGAVVRRAMKGSRAEQLLVARAEAQAVVATNAAAQIEAHTAEQVARKSGHDEYATLPAFTVRGVDVPALNPTEHGLGEVAPLVVQDPYNRARAALGFEPIPAESTWADLGKRHRALSTFAAMDAR